MIYINATILSVLLAYIFSKKEMFNGKSKRIFVSFNNTVLAYFPLIFLSLFRWNLGHDTNYSIGHYAKGYSLAAKGINSLDYSIGFFTFFRFLSMHRIPIFWAYFIISATYMFAVCFYVYKLKIHSVMSVVSFVGIDMFLFTFGAVRQSLAFSFIMIAIVFYNSDKNKIINKILFLSAMILAVLIHYTSIIYVLIYCIDKVYHKYFGISRKNYLMLMIVMFLSTPILYYLIKHYMSASRYASSGYYVLDFTEYYVAFFAVLIIICNLEYNKLIKMDSNNVMILDLLCILLPVFLCSAQIYNPDRVFALFAPLYLMLIPSIYSSEKNRDRRILYLLIFLLVFIWNIKKYFIPGTETYDVFHEYHFVFENWNSVMRLFGR